MFLNYVLVIDLIFFFSSRRRHTRSKRDWFRRVLFRSWIRDRHGNTITIDRFPGGNISKVTSPNGRWLEFDYDAGERVGQARDNLGRAVRYTYDGSGRLDRKSVV